ncbi:hypothetical protein QOZ99_002568 [Angulomicrobium amanitiforme]|uniref:Uncharacterized protein n=1 Tax=Ancylobacter amanitiformis TaxID=217069 RepID=A0ABU0LSI6_9HYPH|nr:hypothetical protein [Ancylobacter amanitiformis]
MIETLHERLGRWPYALLGVALVVWMLPALAQLRFSYYPSTRSGLIKVDRLTGRMQMCNVVGPPRAEWIECAPGKP